MIENIQICLCFDYFEYTVPPPIYRDMTYKKTRNAALRKEFSSLYRRKHLQLSHCIGLLSMKYGIAPSTVERILKQQGKYKD